MKCPKCQSNVKKKHKFCKECGQQLSSSPTTCGKKTASGKTCGTSLNPKDGTCPKCDVQTAHKSTSQSPDVHMPSDGATGDAKDFSSDAVNLCEKIMLDGKLCAEELDPKDNSCPRCSKRGNGIQSSENGVVDLHPRPTHDSVDKSADQSQGTHSVKREASSELSHEVDKKLKLTDSGDADESDDSYMYSTADEDTDSESNGKEKKDNSKNQDGYEAAQEKAATVTDGGGKNKDEENDTSLVDKNKKEVANQKKGENVGDEQNRKTEITSHETASETHGPKQGNADVDVSQVKLPPDEDFDNENNNYNGQHPLSVSGQASVSGGAPSGGVFGTLGSSVDPPRGAQPEWGNQIKEPENGNFKIINKMNTEPAHYVKGKAKGLSGKKGASSSGTNNEPHITVTFQVIISPDFDFSEKKDCVVIRFSDVSLGGWHPGTDQWKLSVEKTLKDGLVMLKAVVPVKKYKLQGDKSIPYKYVVLKNDDENWEHVHFNKGHGIMTNRELFIPNYHLNAKDYWLQCDGMMHTEDSFKSKSRWSKFVSGLKNLANISQGTPHAKFMAASKVAFQHMMPRWKGFTTLCSDEDGTNEPAMEAVEKVNQVMYCMTKQFLSTTFSQCDHRARRQALLDFLQPCFAMYEPEKIEYNSTQLASAVAVLLLIQKHDILQILDGKAINMLLLRMIVASDDPSIFSSAYEHLVGFHFIQKTNDVTKALLKFINYCAKETGVYQLWLCATPLYHFLKGFSQPTKPLSYFGNHRETSAAWWGIEDFKKEVELTKKVNFSVTSTLNTLKPMFSVDPLLARTFLATVKFSDLQEVVTSKACPPEVCLATVCYYLHESLKTWNNYDVKKLAPCLETTVMLLQEMNDGLKNKECLGVAVASSARLCAEISMDLLEPYTNYKFRLLEYHELFHLVLCNCAASLKVYRESILSQNENCDPDTLHKQMSPVENQFCVIDDAVTQWLREALPYHPLTFSYGLSHNFNYVKFTDGRELQVWSNLMSIQFLTDDSTKIWQDGLKERFQKRLTKEDAKMQVEAFCVIDFKAEHYHPLLEECMSECAFKAVENLCKTDSLFLFDKKYHTSDSRKIGRLLSRMFEKAWPIQSYGVLKHVLTWQSFPHYLKMGRGVSGTADLLESRCKELMTKGMSVFTRCYETLKTGDIHMDDLDLVLENKEKFQEMCTIIIESETKAAGDEKKDASRLLEEVNLILKWRKHEVEAFKQLHVLSSTLLNCCKQIIPVEVEDLDKRLKVDVKSQRLTALCVPIQYTAETAAAGDVPTNIPYFNLDPNVMGILEPLNRVRESMIFQQLWDQNGKQAHRYKRQETDGDEALTLDEVVEMVWAPAIGAWQNYANSIQNGSIKFEEINQVFAPFEDSYDALQTELCKMDPNKNPKAKWIETRIHQIKQYHELDKYRNGAKVMLDFKMQFGLTGDFKIVEVLVDAGDNKNKPLSSISEEVVQAGKALENINKSKIECIKQLVKCSKLVEWLQQSMRDTRELKVLVDLAMISAGEGDMEVMRVSCLHSAATGYAPLIYDLPKESGFKHLLHQCEMVWRALESDKDLPKKLADTAKHLDWIKNIKDTHGSVEMTSLAQAESINYRGIYQVGNLNNSQIKDLNSVIKLTVQAEKPKESGVAPEPNREYTFEQLKDLQSKLMLVAGKAEQGKDEVERFVATFDSVTRLASAYIKVCQAGSVLFNDWNCKLICDPKKKNNILVDFNLVKGKLFDKASDNGLTDQVAQLAQFIEDCLLGWQKYIRDKRAQYYPLNHFTTEQLVILRREIAKLSQQQQPSALIYPMLYTVKKDCSQLDLVKAMHAAVQSLQREVEMETEAANAKIAKESDDKSKEEEEFLETISEMYSMALAKRALLAVGPDINDGIIWCMENEDKDEMTSTGQDSMEADEHTDMDELPSSAPLFAENEDTMNAMTKKLLGERENKGSLVATLQSLWKDFLHSVSASVIDYLSIEHLGLVLQHLNQADTPVRQRQFPMYLQKGKPNLIVCPQADVLNTVLSIYMMDPEIPLPTNDEVLLCNAETTGEEVMLLWQRALYDKTGKIYCLVNADLLDYEVSSNADESLQSLKHGAKDYNLVVICSSEREDRSRIVTALDHYRRNQPVVQKRQIQEYLKQQFMRIEQSHVHYASELDFERCSVRLVKSTRAGMGKTLYVKRLGEKVKRLNRRPHPNLPLCVTIPLQQKKVDNSSVLKTLLTYSPMPGQPVTRLFHIDIAHQVEEGVDNLLFNLLVLGYISDNEGFVWRRAPQDLYLIESMPLLTQGDHKRVDDVAHVHHILSILPSVMCRSPEETYNILGGGIKPPDFNEHDSLMDEGEFKSNVFQRPYKYLAQIQGQNCQGNAADCLQILLRYCGIRDPSWSELHHFVWFLNIQLCDCEASSFCSAAAAGDLPGFMQFAVRFMIHMSRDFATRSLSMSEETPGMTSRTCQEGEELIQYQLKRTWEQSEHPYLFFNADRHSMTFLGFRVNANGDIIGKKSPEPLERGVMPKNLQTALQANHVPLNQEFDSYDRQRKIFEICKVMGIEDMYDPDPTYELTIDNATKILAIYMRFRCNIPVIIMGETGCGKTRLIKFMCDLQTPPGSDLKNMVLMKVHGGTTPTDIERKAHQAEKLARENAQRVRHHIDTVLFFDEANTTDAIGLIKEIMCDRTLNGQPLNLSAGLKLVAACNPYRKHSEAMIKHLEQAGLGYHIQADKTTDRLGHIPLRRLVYRVQSLPQSMLPLVWDFGQLNSEVEELYIRQIVLRFMNDDKLPRSDALKIVISKVLATSQKFMRDQKDECSFVSLRDVERVMNVMVWFYEHRELLYDMMDKRALEDLRKEYKGSEDELEELEYNAPGEVTRSLILAIGVCYHACLQKRKEYRETVAPCFTSPCELEDGEDTILEEITRCQNVFLDEIQLDENIARNQALKENVFMMVVCIELRIPLFLVGKPGSSKSLAKTIVADAMQRENASSPLFRTFKQVHMVSFQCSPLATAEGIVGTFRQCASLQKDKNLTDFVSVVVLDEVGLAEDSPRMPLKTLHPLLEDGCQGDETPPDPNYKKVAFIGISNWALDPAKMNRGILVQRGVPDEVELIDSAVGICAFSKIVESQISPVIPSMATAYLRLYKNALKIREFFGLRDFYSLIKMVYAFSAQTHEPPSWNQLEHAVRRNFGGWDDQSVSPVQLFDELVAIENKEKTKHDIQVEAVVLFSVQDTRNGSDLPFKSGDMGSVRQENEEVLVVFKGYKTTGTVPPSIATAFITKQCNVKIYCEIRGAAVVSHPPWSPCVEQKYCHMPCIYHIHCTGEQKDEIKRVLQANIDLSIQRDDHFEVTVTPENTPAGLIAASLKGGIGESESRYLLILTENYAALNILQQHLLRMKDTIIIFGSSFPKDQEYTQVCRNINRIKVCMETGRTVVLLNLDNLYESLYDALNQYYVYMGGQRFVDLGLGTHRVKCRVHKDFRLIVVAEKEVVYQKFPIPLINRLEKHVLAMTTMLSDEQIEVMEKVNRWAEEFAVQRGQRHQRSETKLSVGNVIIGFHTDTAASVVLQVCSAMNQNDSNGDATWEDKVFVEAKLQLLQCATPDAVLRYSKLHGTEVWDIYNKEQNHSSLVDYLRDRIVEKLPGEGIFAQVTTHSKLLSTVDLKDLAKKLKIPMSGITLESLPAFNTEQQFCKAVREFFSQQVQERLFLVQCDSGDLRTDLIACARYSVMDEYTQVKGQLMGKAHVVFVIQLSRLTTGGFVGFPGGKWLSVHVDDLRPHQKGLPSFDTMKDKSVSSLFIDALKIRKPKPGVVTRMDVEYTKEVNEEEESMETEHSQTTTAVTATVQPSDSGLGAELHDETGRPSGEDDSVMDVSDIELEIEPMELDEPSAYNRDEHQQKPSPEDCLDISEVIYRCIQEAAAMLKDEEQSADRATQRIQILLKLLNEKKEGQLTFMDVIGQRVAKLLKEKEKVFTGSARAAHWLIEEAAEPEQIKKAGTMRRATLQCLEKKVTPMLAGVIAMADINSNLDILIKNNDDWVHQLWLALLNEDNISEIKYERDLRSASQNAELKELTVRSVSAGNKFACKMPFSWIIYDQMKSILYNAKSGDLQVENVFQKSPVGKLLSKLVPKSHRKEMVESYLQDFTKMTYKEQVNGESWLIAHAIGVAACEDVTNQKFELAGQDILTIPLIHMTHDARRRRIEHFTQIVHIYKDCVGNISGILEDRVGNPLIVKNEMTLDVMSLYMALESMEPKKGSLDDENERNRWISRVQCLKPVVEGIFLSQSVQYTEYGPVSTEYLQRCRYMWNKILAIQLFIDQICSLHTVPRDLTQKRCMLFWTMLSKDEQTDFKKHSSMKIVEKFLKACNQTASKHFFGKFPICKICEEPMEDPVRLPCDQDHVFCLKCLKNLQSLGDRKCAECDEVYPQDFKLAPLAECSGANAAYKQYKQGCNAFFMDLVSQLCFADNTPPDGAVVDMLMSCVTRTSSSDSASVTTKSFTLFNDGIDATPVVRSFLLQLLLKSSVEQVKAHLTNYFQQSQKFMRDPHQIVELGLLYVQCMEDSFYNNATKETSVDHTMISNATHALTDSLAIFGGSTSVIDSLQAIALARFGLTVTAKIMTKGITRRTNVERLLQAAENLCQNCGTKWAKRFLVKEINKQAGIDAVKSLALEPRLSDWLIPEEAKMSEDDNQPDHFIVCGDLYKGLREAVAQVMLEGDVNQIDDQLKLTTNASLVKESWFHLAVYREVALSFCRNENRQPSEKALTSLQKFVQGHQSIQNKELAYSLINNQLGQLCQPLAITAGQSVNDRNLHAVVAHAFIVFKCLARNAFLEPMLNLAKQPQIMQKSFLPTMPQDELADLRDAVIAGRQAHSGDTVWLCPNGHPYIIGDCGRPVQGSTCATCGTAIGGITYNVAARDNVEFSLTKGDRTAPGHILGPATNRHQEAAPVRELSPASTAVLRMITHMAMLAGTASNMQAVSALIHDANAQGPVAFLWNHILMDMQSLRHAIGQSPDNCAVTMHMIFDRMMTTWPQGGNCTTNWNTKTSRQEWEKQFNNFYACPILNGLQHQLTAANNKMAHDTRLGNNPLIPIIFETFTPPSALRPDLSNLCDEAVMWRHRSRVTVEHLTHEFNENKPKGQGGNSADCNILQAFLRKQHVLQALRFLPSILKLQKFLTQKYQRSVEKTEAVGIRIADFKAKLKDNIKEEYSTLIGDFAAAWSCVKECIHTHNFEVNGSPVSLAEGLGHMTITDDTPLSVLLPNSRGHGLCSVALVKFLVSTQNEFLEEYWRITKTKQPDSVLLQDISPAHLIYYKPEQDLMPIVLANCNYSLEVGKGTSIQYNFMAIEKCIEERFFKGKPRINAIKVDFIDFMEDYTNGMVLKNLRKKIPQEPLTLAVKHQISSEMKSQTDINLCLKDLNLAIKFLMSVGGRADMMLMKFMTQTLSMENPQIVSGSAQRNCQLCHVESLWLLLSFEEAKMLAKCSQDPFGNLLGDSFRVKLTEAQRDSLEKALQHTNVESLLTELYDCIVLYITEKRDPNAEDYADIRKYLLGYTISNYDDDSNEDAMLTQPSYEDVFPGDILVEHAYEVWVMSYQQSLKISR